MPKVKVDLSVGPAMDIEFLAIDGTKATNSITPTGSKWKISQEFEDLNPSNSLIIQLVASGIPGNMCTLEVKVNGKEAKLQKPKMKFNEKGFVIYDEKATW